MDCDDACLCMCTPDEGRGVADAELIVRGVAFEDDDDLVVRLNEASA